MKYIIKYHYDILRITYKLYSTKNIYPSFLILL